MCGIFGVWSLSGERIEEDRVRACRDTIAHRGPDDSGLYVSGGVGLGHRRLSIIDLSPNGRQPITNETGDVRVIFNGEIYNFPDLRRDLQARGHVFKSNTDSEVIVHGYEEWGEDCFERFLGMFAIGIWDERSQQMILARDPLGKKPLYYFHDPQKILLYASTLRPLVLWPGFPRIVDAESVGDYLQSGCIPAPRCIFRNTRKVLPGQYIVFSRNGKRREHLYWDLPSIVCNGARSAASQAGDEVDQLHAVLSDAVKIRMTADVPLGAFLSGGVDSSLVVALMAEASKRQVRTYSIGFAETRLDESHYAHAVAKALGVQNTVMIMSADVLLDYMPKVVTYYDEPMADFSLLPTLAVSELARDHVTVVLTGDGGDEVFGGYPGYATMSTFASYYRLVPGTVRRWMSALHRYMPESRIRNVVFQLGASDPFRFVGMYQKRVLRDLNIADLMPDGVEVVPTEEQVARVLETYSGLSLVEAAMLHDTTHRMVDSILHKVDRGSMAHALEVRCPILDRRVVEFAFSLPLEAKVRGRRMKLILRRLLARYIPERLINRPKMGFSPPLREWFAGPLRGMVMEMLSRESMARRALLCPDRIERVLNEHYAGKKDYTWFIWAALMLETWFRRYIDGAADGSVT